MRAMSNHTVAESVRLSRAQQHAAEIAAEAQQRARDARIERLEQRVQRTIQALFTTMAVLWLIGLVVIVAMEVRF